MSPDKPYSLAPMGNSSYIDNPLPDPADIAPDVKWFEPTEVEEGEVDKYAEIEFMEGWD